MTVSKKYFYALAISNLMSWAVIVLLWTTSNTRSYSNEFEEITVEKLNVVNERGKVVMTISNKHKIPGPTFGGTEYPQAFGDGRQNLSGIIFFNEQGDEVGGLVYNGFPVENRHWAGGHLSFDQWKHNQVVALQYLDNGSSKRAGLRIWDRPTESEFKDFLDVGLERMNEPDQSKRDSLRSTMNTMRQEGLLGTERMFVGSQNGNAQVQIRDTEGNIRIRLTVDETDEAKLVFLNENGDQVASYPDH